MSESDTQTRFETTSKDCYDAYIVWKNAPQDIEARGTLNSCIHELRKVVSRFEIEVAVSERQDSRQKPLAAPAHKNADRRAQSAKQNEKKDNAAADSNAPATDSPKKRKTPRKRTTGTLKASSE